MPIVSFSYMTLKIGFYMVEITPLVFGNVSFLVNNNFIKNNELTNLQSFFDRDTILKGKDVLTKGGRGKTILFKKDGFDLILRHYKRGGLFGKLVKDSFFTFESYCNRSFDEFKLLNYMLSVNLPVPKPVIAREIKEGIKLKQDIVVERLKGFVDLSEVISKRELTETELANIGKTIKQFFDKDILHTDLNIRNILINDNAEVYIIDFDKCFNKKLDVKDRIDVVSRLHRSFRKEVTKKGSDSVFYKDASFKILLNNALPTL